MVQWIHLLQKPEGIKYAVVSFKLSKKHAKGQI
jgi:hypothetical protein